MSLKKRMEELEGEKEKILDVYQGIRINGFKIIKATWTTNYYAGKSEKVRRYAQKKIKNQKHMVYLDNCLDLYDIRDKIESYIEQKKLVVPKSRGKLEEDFYTEESITLYPKVRGRSKELVIPSALLFWKEEEGGVKLIKAISLSRTEWIEDFGRIEIGEKIHCDLDWTSDTEDLMVRT